MKRFIFTNLLFVLATLFFACKDDRKCTYNEQKQSLACPEKNYKTTNIHGVVWMAENLNYFRADTSICYDADYSKCKKYGYLYTWNASQGNVCPTGWKLPSRDDFHGALDSLTNSELFNENGFNLQRSGFRYYDGDFVDEGISTSFWTSEDFDKTRAYLVRIVDSTVTYEHYNKKIFASIRCIKN